MHSLISTRRSTDAAIEYLARRGCLHKLATPTPCLFSSPNHGAAIRQHRAAIEARGFRVSWRPFFNLKHA